LPMISHRREKTRAKSRFAVSMCSRNSTRRDAKNVLTSICTYCYLTIVVCNHAFRVRQVEEQAKSRQA
jgi:hypothetical protein